MDKVKGLTGTLQGHSRILCAIGAAFIGIGTAIEFSPAVMTGLALIAVCVVAALSPRKGL